MAAAPMSYSVWLKPAPDSAFGKQLASLINTHAAALGTPAFAPHVTLLGGFTAASDVRMRAFGRVLLAVMRAREALKPRAWLRRTRR